MYSYTNVVGYKLQERGNGRKTTYYLELGEKMFSVIGGLPEVNYENKKEKKHFLSQLTLSCE